MGGFCCLVNQMGSSADSISLHLFLCLVPEAALRIVADLCELHAVQQTHWGDLIIPAHQYLHPSLKIDLQVLCPSSSQESS